MLSTEGWARDGLTDEQIAHNMGVAYSTLREWKKKFPALSAALKKGKEVVDRQVENALLKKALGFDVVEVTRERIKGVLIPTKEVTKYYPPDTTAAIFWLKNRKSDMWRDRKDISHDGEINTKVIFANEADIPD